LARSGPHRVSFVGKQASPSGEGGHRRGRRPLGEIFRQFAVPGPRRVGHCPLRGHALLERAAPIITVV